MMCFRASMADPPHPQWRRAGAACAAGDAGRAQLPGARAAPRRQVSRLPAAASWRLAPAAAAVLPPWPAQPPGV